MELNDSSETKLLQLNRAEAGKNYLQSRSKRLLDLFLCICFLPSVLPMLVIIALLIKAESRGPVLFKQVRNGANGNSFQIFKFRTMKAEVSEQTFLQAKRNDKRVTRLGRALRKTSLDELPQIFNVLKGEMSFVGPRPHPIELDEMYSSEIPNYRARFLCKPGISGLAQVHGARGATETTEEMQARIKYDLTYLENASFFLDLRILFLTVREVIASRHAY